MKYVTSIRVGLNDIKALINLEESRRDSVVPLLNMRGNRRYLDTFIERWTVHPYFLDVSRFPSDASDTFIVENDLLNAADAYAGLRKLYREIAVESAEVIPVISWSCTDAPRDTIQFALATERSHSVIAVRANLASRSAEQQSTRLLNILHALDKLSSTWVLLDCGVITQANDLAASSVLVDLLETLRPLNLAGVSIMSTSFPDNKPANGTARSVMSIDLAAQSRVATGSFTTAISYGDYAATNPSAAIEFIRGMHVIPFGSYFTNGEWWQCRRGADKEFSAYVDIANDIISLPGFHGSHHCWANTEIARIAQGSGGTGNNGTWNGLRINQHICGMLDQLKAVGYPASTPSDPDDDTDEL